MEKFKVELNNWLHKNHVRASHLAKMAGVAPSVISFYVNDKRGITEDSIIKLKVAMNQYKPASETKN